MHWFFILLFFFEFLCPFESWSNPMFDHDLNKFKTWIWKIKHVSFVVTPKWSSILRGFLKFPCLKPKNHVLLFMLDFIRQSLGLGVAWYINFLVWICLDIIYQLNWWMLTRWHKSFWNFHAWKPKTTSLHACLTS